jgi:hypothetical protein
MAMDKHAYRVRRHRLLSPEMARAGPAGLAYTMCVFTFLEFVS